MPRPRRRVDVRGLVEAALARPHLVAAAAVAIVLVVTALAFPTTAAAGAASAVLVALAGALVAANWQRISPKLACVPRWAGRLVAVAIVLAVAAAIFWPAFDIPVRHNTGDWGTHHAIVAALIAGLRRGHIPHWVQGLSSGASPFELYPALTYFIAAGIALLTGATHHIDTVLMVIAVAAHVFIAVGATRIAARIAPWPLAVLAGVVTLMDRGTGTSGGSSGVLYWAILHNAVSEAFALAAIAAVLDTLERPRLRSSIAIWIFTGLATAAHPSGLLLTAAAVVGLLVVAAVARDLRPLRCLFAAGHLLIGTCLGAVAWLPLSERLLRYGVHYGTPQDPPWVFFSRMIAHSQPISTFAIAVYIGYVGVAAAALSRRARPTFVAMTAATLFLGISSWPYVLFGLSPSPAFARMSSARMLSLVKPLVYVGAAYAIAVVVNHARRRWGSADLRSRVAVGALLALALGGACRSVVPFYYYQRWRSRRDVHAQAPDQRGFSELIAWARNQAAAMQPDRFGRLLFDGDKNYVFHITAETGLPTLYVGALPDLLLRERIENRSPASLRRFDIRWVVAAGHPPTLGDPASERSFGHYYVRELRSWDGKFARIERGTGTVTVTALHGERVAVVLKSKAPALIALGTGYYPRWRVHSHGHLLPTYALPAVPGGHTHVVAAWLPPGRSVFTADGPLPSDGAGDVPALAALLVAAAGVVVWSRRRWRLAALRRIATASRLVRLRRRLIFQTAAVGLPLIILVAGVVGWLTPARALKLGNGLFGGPADVSLRRHDGHWHHCAYSRLRGAYACPGLGQVSDGSAAILNDAAPSWKFPTPVIQVWPERKPKAWHASREVHFRIRTRVRLDGGYWLAARHAIGRAVIDGVAKPIRLGGKVHLSFDGDRRRRVTITGWTSNRHASIALVKITSLEPERPFLAGPPAAPPPAVTALMQPVPALHR